MHTKQSTGLQNLGDNHCFLNSAVQAIYHLTDLSEVQTDLVKQSTRGTARELLKVLDRMHSPTGKVSVDGLRTTLAQSFEATDLFQAREYGDSYEAYSAIMQQMAQAEVTLVEKFRVLISQESKCECVPWTSEDWSSDCFGLSVLVSGKNSFLDQLREDFQGKALSMCLGSNSCEHTEVRRKLLKVPEVLVFQLNFPTKRRKSRVGRSYLVETLNLRDILHEDNALEGCYQLKGAVFMLPGHFFSGFKTSRGWTIFNDSSVSSFNASTFKEFSSEVGAAQPYLVFYQKVGQVVLPSPIHPMADLLIEALHSIKLLSDEADRAEALRYSQEGTLANEVYDLLVADLESYADYIKALSSKALLTQWIQDWTIQDSSQAYNHVLQQLNQSEPKATLVDKLKLCIVEQTNCSCMNTPICNDWSDECFTLPLYIGEARWSVAEQIQKQLKGEHSLCHNGIKQCLTTHIKTFKAVPNILTLQMNYSEHVKTYKPLESFSIKHKTFPTNQSYRLVRAVYNFEGKAVSYSKQDTSRHLKVFSELSINGGKKFSFETIKYQPGLLFYKREEVRATKQCCLVF
jgi:hypothetical protein